MSHELDFDDARLRQLLCATDEAAPLTNARADALARQVAARAAPWIALHAEAAAVRPGDGSLDALGQRIRARAAPTLAAYRRGVRRSPWMRVAIRWSRPALPLAIAAGLGAMMVLLRTPRPEESADAAETTSAYAAAGGSARATLAVMIPEAAIDDGSEVTP